MMMKEIVLHLIILLTLVNSEEEKKTQVKYPKYNECDVSIFAIPRFIYNYYLFLPHFFLEKLWRKIRNVPLGHGDFSGLFFFLPFFAPFVAVQGIAQFIYCFFEGQLRLTTA